MKRIFDFLLSFFGLLFFCVPMLVMALIIRTTSPGPVIYWSKRVGRHNKRFRMPKFRTMLARTPQKATHLMQDPDKWVTPIGRILRRYSLDELPQLWNILRGQMSFVGPRPALYNQFDLVEERTRLGVHELIPGLTGWAQINGRDEIAIPDKVKLDVYYLENASFLFDLSILWRTFFKVARKEGIRH